MGWNIKHSTEGTASRRVEQRLRGRGCRSFIKNLRWRMMDISEGDGERPRPYVRMAGKKVRRKSRWSRRRKPLRTETDETVRIARLMKQKIRRDERVKIRETSVSSPKAVRKEIDFYSVRKIVKKSEMRKSRVFDFLRVQHLCHYIKHPVHNLLILLRSALLWIII